MENQLAILLLIVPGYISRKIYKHTNDVRDELSTFEETLYCLMFSGIISIVAATIMLVSIYGFCFNYSSLQSKDLQVYANSLEFIAKYIGWVLIVATILGLSTYRLNEWYTYWINKARGTQKTAVILNQSIFDIYFNDVSYHHYIELYKDDKFICRGRLNNCVEKYKELGIEPCEDQLIKLEEKLGGIPYKHIYYDGRLGIMIKEYDIQIPANQKE